MAGLLSMGNMTGGAPAGMPPAAAPDPMSATTPDDSKVSDTGDGTPNVSPEEQAQYDRFVTNGLHVIYGGNGGEKGVRPDILNRLKESQDPLENLANTSVWLVTMLETSAEKGGQPLNQDVLLHGGKSILEELATVADAAKIHDYSEKEMEGAWYRALDLYRETATQAGKFDPNAAKEEFAQIEQADQQGRLGDILPQLGKDTAVTSPPAGAGGPAPIGVPAPQGG